MQVINKKVTYPVTSYRVTNGLKAKAVTFQALKPRVTNASPIQKAVAYSLTYTRRVQAQL